MSTTKKEIVARVMEMRSQERTRKGLSANDSDLFGLDFEPMTEAEAYRVRLTLITEQVEADKQNVMTFNLRKGEIKRQYDAGVRAIESVFKEGGGRFRRF